jgi:hypothetical protein
MKKLITLSLVIFSIATLMSTTAFGSEVPETTAETVVETQEEPTTEKEVFVKEYKEVIVDGETKFIITLDNEENILVDSVERDKNIVTYEINGKKNTLSFLTKDTSLLVEKVNRYVDLKDKLDKLTKLAAVSFALLCILLLMLADLDKKYLIALLVILTTTTVLPVVYSSKVNNLKKEIVSESVLIYKQEHNGELPIDDETSFSQAGETGFLYEISKEKIVNVDFKLANIDFEGFLVEEKTGDIYNTKLKKLN